ncbi:SMP-30/gluconolactonase/LRE family protein [Aquimarina sp. 2201CG5-10]|uniref:SMP-30/gluconolactonase/LRE family protein n=1 Tax=Aquimarina callyspongiae TaxID=3098150 RepID=UPI002AB3F930|nr:SMP-30/gluconolactonase/LRE family protein [Aquimarina sp. 2201CG5-10]MDY8138938.1 SMP-30/gluconolactonase/LRE family protein [Aquimarina sp. 2201CG5-10]
MSSCDKEGKSIDFTSEGTFTDGVEGPATDYQGNVYAVNYQKQGTIGKITPDGVATLFLELPSGSIGNGIRFGSTNEMYIADYKNHNILKVDLKTKALEIFAHQPLANQPNDLAIGENETIYASDPNWSDNTGNIWKVTKEKGFELLESGMGTTNGIEVSTDKKRLYVNESVQRKVWVYDIAENGTLKNKKLFFSFNDHGLDGMRCDHKGNLYICRYDKGTVVVLSPEGKLLKEFILKGKKPTNITFSNDFKEFYITVADRGNIEKVKNTL